MDAAGWTWFVLWALTMTGWTWFVLWALTMTGWTWFVLWALTMTGWLVSLWRIEGVCRRKDELIAELGAEIWRRDRNHAEEICDQWRWNNRVLAKVRGRAATIRRLRAEEIYGRSPLWEALSIEEVRKMELAAQRTFRRLTRPNDAGR